MRSTSAFQPASASGQSPLLLARISEKKAELESLKELRDLSAQMAGQMEMLEEKLGTLANGTEGIESLVTVLCDLSNTDSAIAAILSNWHNVLRAIRMASSESIIDLIKAPEILT